MEAPVSIEAAEGDKKGPPAFTATFYTGGKMNINGWDLPVAIDLAGLQNGNVLIANLDHDRSKRVGAFEVTNDGTSLVANGTVSAVNQWATEVVESAKNGYPWQASLEVMPASGGVEQIKAGQKVTVNGQEMSGPLYVTRKGTLKGFGFVTHGADDNTAVAIAAAAAQSKEKRTMKAEVAAWVKETYPSVDQDTITPDLVKAFEDHFAKIEAGKKVSDPPKNEGETFHSYKEEMKRREEIRATANEFLEKNRNFDRAWFETIEAMHDEAVENKTSPLEFRTKLLEATYGMGGQINVSVSRSKDKITEKVLEAAICLSGGMEAAALDRHFKDEDLQAAHDKFKHGVGLKQIYRLGARANGHNFDHEEVTIEMQQAAFGMHGQGFNRLQHAAGGFSTLSLPGILGNTAGKFLLEGWGGGEMVWKEITDTISVRDFKQITQYKLSGSMKYEKVGAGGELVHGAVSEGSYTNQADTYGKMFAITRTDIINDDLGALTRVPLELGYGANDAFNEVFWTEFLENAGNFYHSSNGNTASGTITASTVLGTLAASEAAFLVQTKPNGTPLGIMPNKWLVPPLAKRIAMNALNSSNVTGGSTTVPEANTFQGEYKIVCSAYIANSAFTNYSTVKHYLIANRPGFSPIQTAFLNGRQTPVVETAQADFNTLGVSMRAYHDFGVNKMEYRAVVQGSGA